MADYVLPGEYPYKNEGEQGALPLLAEDYNPVLAAVADLAAAGGRVPALEANPVLNVDTTGAAVGSLVAATQVDAAGNPTQFGTNVALLSRLSTAVAGSTPASRSRLWTGQEPSVVRHGGKWRMFYGLPGQGIQYRECDETANPTVAANWSAPTQVLTGWSHHSLYVEGANLYIYAVDVANENIGVATATTASWTTWTKQPTPVLGPIGNTADPHSGNTYLVKRGDGDYVMFAEGTWTGTIDGATATMWQTWVGTGTSPLGPFTLGDVVTSLRPRGVGQVSGMSVYREADQWVTIYHGGGLAGANLPNNIYRAVNRGDLAADTWEILDGGRAFLRRAHEAEFDQAVDPVVCEGPDGRLYEFHSGNQNANLASAGTFNVMATRLYPGLSRFDGAEWRPEAPPADGQPAIQTYSGLVHQDHPHLNPTGTACFGVWGAVAAPSALGGVVRTNSLAASGDWIAWQMRLTAGTYSLRILAEKGPDMGTLGLNIIPGTLRDVALKTQSFDLYAAAQSFNNALEFTFTLGPEFDGPLWIRFRASSKNAASSGYRLADQGWRLLRLDTVDPSYVAPATPGAGIADDFNRANSTSLGPLWSSITGFQVLSNALTRTATDSVAVVLLAADSLGAADMRAKATLTRGTSTSVGVVLRAVDTTNYVGCRVNDVGHVLIYKVVAGTTTSLAGNTGLGWVDGATLTLDATGNTFTAYIDGAQVLQTTHTEPALAGGRRVGLRANSVGATLPTLDNFAANAH